MTKDDLKLCYVLKIGYNSRKEGLYEFLFTKDLSCIKTDQLGWDDVPASANANPPGQSSVDMVLSLKTKKIDFKCLHELDDRPYSDGYFTIHCLAFEDTESENHDVLYDETPLIVFHYGMKASEVKELFMTRDIMLTEIDVADSGASEEEPEEELQDEFEEDED